MMRAKFNILASLGFITCMIMHSIQVEGAVDSSRFKPLALYGCISLMTGAGSNVIDVESAKFGASYIRADCWGLHAEHNRITRRRSESGVVQGRSVSYVLWEHLYSYDLQLSRSLVLNHRLRITGSAGPSLTFVKTRSSDDAWMFEIPSISYDQYLGASLAGQLEISLDPLFGVNIGFHSEVTPIISYTDFHFGFALGLHNSKLIKS